MVHCVKQSQLPGGCRPVSKRESVGQAPPYTQDVGRGRPTYAEPIVRNKPNFRQSRGRTQGQWYKQTQFRATRGVSGGQLCGTKPIPGGAGWDGARGTWAQGLLPRPSPLGPPAFLGHSHETNPISGVGRADPGVRGTNKPNFERCGRHPRGRLCKTKPIPGGRDAPTIAVFHHSSIPSPGPSRQTKPIRRRAVVGRGPIGRLAVPEPDSPAVECRSYETKPIPEVGIPHHSSIPIFQSRAHRAEQSQFSPTRVRAKYILGRKLGAIRWGTGVEKQNQFAGE
jgi:hypothetical protein